MSVSPYIEQRAGRSRFITVRGLRYHALQWGDTALATPQRPPLVMLHGWMDVAASFQFVVDALAGARLVLALDWRGFGLSEPSGADAYWFPDYLGDLDSALDTLSPEQPVDLLGHSMGGNVAMLYAGVRPARVRRLINLEGFGLPASRPEHAPQLYAQWLDELKQPARLRSYDSVEAVAARLRQNNPLLTPERAAWLAPRWSRQRGDDGTGGPWDILADPAHKRRNPVPYQKAEVLEVWKRISAPMLWVEGDRSEVATRWQTRYPREEFEARLSMVPTLQCVVLSPAGHMLHHDQPYALAQHIERFLDAA